jgi:2,4-dienoyl-CoA reductase-like NADH-dependent reductase (Old Yellow Enzyme family)
MFKRFDLKTLDDLKCALSRSGLHLPFSDNLACLAEPVKIGKRTLANRFTVQPMEGVDADPVSGAPSELTNRRYRRYAAGGSALIWAEAVAVSDDGVSGLRQLRVNRSNLDVYKRVVELIRSSAAEECGHEVTSVIQLTHSGRYSRPGGVAKPLKAQHNPELDLALGMQDAETVSDDYLLRLQDKFVEAALLLAEAGFDGIDLKAVHGYLVAELLGARRRAGRFGGSYENRTRFFSECVQRIKEALPRGHFVTARCTVLEPSAYPYGWGVAENVVNDRSPDENVHEVPIDLAEPLRLLQECAALGMPLINISIGYPRFQAYMNRPHDNALRGMPPPPENPLRSVVRFQNIIREVQKTLPEVPVVTAALAWLRHLMPQVAAGLIEEGWCTLIGQGRNAFAYPDSVRDILEKGAMDIRKCCTTCSLCSQIMKDGVGCAGCVVRDRDIYAAELLKGLKRDT